MKLIEDLLPSGAGCAEVVGEFSDSWLFPEEQRLIVKAVEGRRRAFATGRACARSALAELGIDAVAITRDARRAPQWPDGVVGSITHCRGYCAAAVARSEMLRTLGIDAEPHEALPERVLEQIADPGERSHLARLYEVDRGICWDRLLFSAKESVIKAWYSLSCQVLTFTESRLTFHPSQGGFSARVLGRTAFRGGEASPTLEGRWSVAAGLILTTIAVEPTREPSDRAGRCPIDGRRSSPVRQYE